MIEGQNQAIKAQKDVIKAYSELVKTLMELIKVRNLKIDELISLVKNAPSPAPAFTEVDRALLTDMASLF